MWPTTGWHRPLKNTCWVSDAPLSYQSIRRFSVSIKLLVTDIDRTLVNSPHCASPSPRNIAALRAASEQGVTVAIASGRNQASCRTFARELGLACPILGNNGAEVFDGGELRSRKPLSAAVSSYAVEFARAHKLATLCFSSCCMYLGDLGSASENEALRRHYAVMNRIPDSSVITIDSQEALSRLLEDGALQIEFLAPAPEQAQTARLAWRAAMERGELPPMEVTSSYGLSFEIDALGVSKGAGVHILAGARGLTADEILCVGDSENDASMFHACAHSVAMGNASDAVKAQARHVTAPVTEDGLALAIEKYVLGL